jgi:hypothetical protein
MQPVFTRLPVGVLIKGSSATFRPSDCTTNTSFGGTWGGGGQTYDLSWFTRQIDVMSATGGNTVRIYGEIEYQIAGSLLETDYLNRVDAVLSYAGDHGLYVVFTGASAYQLLGVASAGVITSTARQLLKDAYNRVRAHSNVIAFDPIQEASAWVNGSTGSSVVDGSIHQAPITSGQLTTIIQTIYADMKAQSTDLPITFSGIQGDYTHSAMWLPYGLRTNVNACLDYLDFHCYYSTSYTDVTQGFTEAAGRPIIVGEFGMATTPNPMLPGCDYAQMLRIAQRMQIAGYMAFAVFDHGAVSGDVDSWGMANNDGTLRSGRGTVFVNFPTTIPVIPDPLYVGTDLRLASMAGGGKLQARNPSTNTWADVDQWTNP